MTPTAARPRSTLDPRINDADLARAVGRGDHDAIRLMMRRHNQMLYRTARSILRDDAEAEDAVQEAYIKAIAAIGTFRAEAKLSTWLVRIAANEALERRRRRQRSAEVIRLDEDLPHGETMHDIADAGPTPENEALRGETRRIMEEMIDTLPDAFRTVFVLRAIEEMPAEEVAVVLAIPEATVRTRYFRARALLRASLSSKLDLALDQAFGFAGARCDRIVEAVMARLTSDKPAGA